MCELRCEGRIPHYGDAKYDFVCQGCGRDLLYDWLHGKTGFIRVTQQFGFGMVAGFFIGYIVANIMFVWG